MSDIVTTERVSSQTLEDVLANGDLSKLTPEQRVAYYFQVCKSLGLNPYTRPFDYITLNGKRVLYAKRDATDQLRQLRNITLTVTDKHIEDDLFIVTVRATDAKGRSDEDFGAVPISGLKGEPRANAILKGITKAKRRVTLSICGLGMNDESEVASIPGAVTEHLELPPPDLREAVNDEVLLKAVAASTRRGERKMAPIAEGLQSELARVLPPEQLAGVEAWLATFQVKLDRCQTRAELDLVVTRADVTNNLEHGPGAMKREINAMIAAAYDRLPAVTRETPDDLEIAGEAYLAAG